MAGKNEYRFKEFRRQMSTNGGATLIICVVGVVLGIVLLAVGSRDIDGLRTEYKSQTAIVKMFDVDGTPEIQAKKRRELATSIIVVKRFAKAIPELNDPQFTKQLPTIAKTGEAPKLHPIEPSVARQFKPFVPWWLGITFSLASLLFGLLYWDLCRAGPHLLCDLPWKRAWPWLVPLCAPWLVPFLIGSYFRARPSIKATNAKKVEKTKK